MNKNDGIDDAFVSSRGAPFGKGTRLNIPTKNPVKVTLIIMGHLLALWLYVASDFLRAVQQQYELACDNLQCIHETPQVIFTLCCDIGHGDRIVGLRKDIWKR